MRGFQRLTLIGWLLLTPAVAYAQASIAGTVKDTSGAVLPGVTVEASSPALIEKVRSVTTDATGQYKIIDLRPGTYSVTFSVTGFSSVKRENIELVGSSTATVNADLAVGSVAETVTVTAESPVVDIQSTQRSKVIDDDTIAALPVGRSQYNLAVLLPGVTLSSFGGSNIQDVGGTRTLEITIFTVHGSRPTDQRLMINGLTSRNLLSSAWASNLVPDMGTASEVTFDYSSGMADAYGAGFTINLIPKEGGNAFRGSIFATGANKSFQSTNYSDELKAAGLSSPNDLKRMYDINPSIGGPIIRNRVWFFGSMRWQENSFYYAGAYFNKNANDLSKWNYEPDLARRAEALQTANPTGSLRLTWQATPRNKIGFSIDPQARYWVAPVANHSAEQYSSWSFTHETLTTATWSAPVTSKLLLDARFGHHATGFVDDYPTDSQKDAIPVQDLNTGLIYRGRGYCCIPFAFFGTMNAPHIMQAQASASYVTGAHAMKFGWQNDFGNSSNCQYDNTRGLFYQFSGGVTDAFGRSLTPVSLQMHALPWCSSVHLSADMGIFVQDKWTYKRATINAGVRFDYFKSDFPEQHLGPTVWTPTRDVTIPARDYSNMKDVTPRVGLAYDVFGTGRMALKVAWGKYMQGLDPNAGNPIQNLSYIANRSWTPSLPFGHPNYYEPQCDLLNAAANGDCGALDNALFGKLVPSAAVDPATYTGWGHRAWSQEFSTSVQYEIAPRVAVDVGYYRRWYGNFTVVDNRAVGPADFTIYTLTVPNDPRLPQAGKTLSTPEVSAAKASLVDNYTTFADNFGKRYEHWNGVDVSVSARMRVGLTLQGGISTGRTSTDNCDLYPAVPEVSLLFGIIATPREYCHVDTKFLTQVKFLGTYLVPKVDVQFGATFQSTPGPQNSANELVLPFQVGLPSFSAAGVRLINLLEPGTNYTHRVNQLDLRFSKILRMGTGDRYRVSINFDLANALNSNYVLGRNGTWGAVGIAAPTWLAPLNIMDARLFKFGAQFDF
jgi:hypothetical protein